MGALQGNRYTPLGDGDGLSESRALGRGVRPQFEIRRSGGATVDGDCVGFRPWRAACLRRPDTRVSSDLWGRGVVALRTPYPARRSAVSGAAVPRLQGHGHEVCRTDHVRPWRYRQPDSGWNAGIESKGDLDPLSGGRSQEAGPLRVADRDAAMVRGTTPTG